MLLVGLLMLVATPVSAQSDQPQQLTEGVNVVDLTPGDVREVRFTVDSATAAMLSWSCSFCEVEVSETDPGLPLRRTEGTCSAFTPIKTVASSPQFRQIQRAC